MAEPATQQSTCLTRFSLSDKVVIVTGASSGIGEQAARALSSAGAMTVLAARRTDRIEALAATLPDSLAVACDVRNPEAGRRTVAAARDHFGSVDVLVNVAGIAAPSPAEDEDLASFENVVRTNLIGLFAITQAAARTMLDQRSGSIINISSTFGMVASQDGPVASYAASKGGVINLTRELAVQWGPSNVRVNCIAPGPFPSELNDYLRDPAHIGHLAPRTALKRVARRDELDGPLVFLASDASSYVTGQTLVVDGGWTSI